MEKYLIKKKRKIEDDGDTVSASLQSSLVENNLQADTFLSINNSHDFSKKDLNINIDTVEEGQNVQERRKKNILFYFDKKSIHFLVMFDSSNKFSVEND